MDEVTSLYERDFLLWLEEQARALRAAAQAGANLPLDWDNLAEEIETLGRSEKSEVRRRLRTIIEHLLKLEHSPAQEPRAGWRSTIARTRLDLEEALETSPSLRRLLPDMIRRELPIATRLLSGDLLDRGEITAPIPIPAYTEAQVLGDWLPP